MISLKRSWQFDTQRCRFECLRNWAGVQSTLLLPAAYSSGSFIRYHTRRLCNRQRWRSPWQGRKVRKRVVYTISADLVCCVVLLREVKEPMKVMVSCGEIYGRRRVPSCREIRWSFGGTTKVKRRHFGWTMITKRDMVMVSLLNFVMTEDDAYEEERSRLSGRWQHINDGWINGWMMVGWYEEALKLMQRWHDKDVYRWW